MNPDLEPRETQSTGNYLTFFSTLAAKKNGE
jgi:hypothetical protein